MFQFDDVAAVEVRTDAPFARGFFGDEYAFHRVNIPRIDLPLAVLDFQLGASAPAGFTRHTHKVLARWAYRIGFQPGRVEISAYGNRFAVPMVHHMLLHPTLRWLAAGAGTLLLHAGAVVKNGKSVIFTGEGGAGKTTTTSLALASGGWQVHADDYVFLHPEKSAAISRAYVTRSHLYLNLLRWVPQVAARLTPWERIRLEFFGRLRAWSGERLKWPVRVAANRLWPDAPVALQATPAALVLLERGDSPALIAMTDLPGVVETLLQMNFGEARHFLALLEKSENFDPAWLESWRETERGLLTQLTRQISVYRLVLPRSNDAEAVRASLLPALEQMVA